MVLLIVHVPIAAAGWCAPHDPGLQFRDRAGEPPAVFRVARAAVEDPPGTVFVLGTDDLGRDVWSRALHGARNSLGIAALATVATLLMALLAGVAAGGTGRLADTLIMRSAEIVQAIPWMYLLLAVRAWVPLDLDPGTAFLTIVTMLALAGWARPARLVRGVALATSGRDYITAARAAGADRFRILLVHVMPATWPVVLAQATWTLPQFVMAEVALSFLGLGLPEPVPSLGTLLADASSLTVVLLRPWQLMPVVSLACLLIGYQACARGMRNRLPEDGGA